LTPSAVLLAGPTASGKSTLAMRLAADIPLEIVSVDSAQVYIGMDVGTAKPSHAERGAVPHHLLDIVPPTERYSAARFRDDALRAIADIRSRGRLPLLVGGTMLYFKALLHGLSALPEADESVRAELDREAAEVGWPAMHARLAVLDPETAQRLQPRDSQRIQRALEVFRITGEPMSRLLTRTTATPAVPVLSLSLMPEDRSELHRRIELRFDDMLSNGLVAELESLRARHALTADLPSMRAVGYRQAWEHLEGRIDAAELRERGIHATRQLAKRQITWLRSWRSDARLDCFEPALYDKVRGIASRAIE
jgi:tRNA dimethylallyltransferase